MSRQCTRGIATNRVHGRLTRFCISRPGRGLRPVVLGCSVDRRPLVTAPAETDERRGRIVELRFARARPPFPPFAFKPVDVVARRGIARVLIGIRRQGWQRFAIGGQGALDPVIIAIEKRDHVLFFIEDEPVIGQMVVQRDLFDMLPKSFCRALRAGLLQQDFKRDLPGALATAMLTRQLIDAAFERLAEPEIIPVQR